MSINFEPTFWWDDATQSVKFYAHYESRRIHCAISRPALEYFVFKRFIPPHGVTASHLEHAFEEHRGEIELQVLKKLRTGHFEPEGKIFVKAADFK